MKLLSAILLLFIQITKIFHHIGILQVESLDNLNASYPITIERVATFTNGCYKQRIIEPDLWNAKRFFETEQLICPPAVNASTFTVLTQQLQSNNSVNHTRYFVPANNTSPVAVLHPPAVVPATIFTNSPHNVSYVPQVAPVGFMTPPAAPAASYPVSPTVERQQPFYPFYPAHNSNATSHVAVISKKTSFFNNEKRKSSANSLTYFSNNFLVFAVIAIFMNCYLNY